MQLLPQRFRSRIAKNPLRRRIPERDALVGPHHDDGVLRRLSDLAEFFLAFRQQRLSLLALCDVSIHAAIAAELPFSVKNRHAVGLKDYPAAIFMKIGVFEAGE